MSKSFLSQYLSLSPHISLLLTGSAAHKLLAQLATPLQGCITLCCPAGVTLAIIDMEMMLEVLMGIMDMEVDKVANEVADMV